MTMFADLPDILNVHQVADALGIGTKAAYTLIQEKRLGHLRMGKTIKVPKFCLVEFVQTASLMVMQSGCEVSA